MMKLMSMEQAIKKLKPKDIPFKLGTYGRKKYPITEFYKTEKELRLERGDDQPGGWLVGAMFFPSSYEESVGKGNPVYCDSPSGILEWHPILSSRLISFLESQGPGCTDMQIPMKTTMNGKVYIYTGDGMTGDSLLICPQSRFTIRKALRMIEDNHLEQWNEEDDEEWC